MLNRLIMKKIMKDNDTHVGANVNWYYMYLPMVDELYVSKEIKQTFKIFGLNLHATTSMVTMQLPPEIISMFESIVLNSGDAEEVKNFDMNVFKDNLKVDFQLAYNSMYDDAVKAYEGDDLEGIKTRLYHAKLKMVSLLSEWTTKEKGLFKQFVKDGFVPLFKVPQGVSTSYYLAKVIHDRVVVIKVDTMTIKEAIHFSAIETLYFTKTLMKTLVDVLHNGKKGVV